MYSLERGDGFKCIKTFKMESGEKAYERGKEYYSDVDGCITDSEHDVYHRMEGVEDFFEHFKLIK